jgi:hypothetical protein
MSIKSRPILFSTPMVLALRKKRKTQTRRIVVIDGPVADMKCKYGDKGDELWVRETWKKVADKYYYKADGASGQMKPSIHMHKVGARYFLTIKSISVQNIQDITELECIYEGVYYDTVNKFFTVEGTDIVGSTAYEAFRMLWVEINGLESWESNPLVWVIEFELKD